MVPSAAQGPVDHVHRQMNHVLILNPVSAWRVTLKALM